MSSFLSRNRLLALLILLLMTLAPVCGICHETGHAAGAAAQQNSCAGEQAPGCPDDGTTDPGCDDCAACPCHAPLPTSSPDQSVRLLVAPLAFVEVRFILPEVYLSLFDPPDVSA